MDFAWGFHGNFQILEDMSRNGFKLDFVRSLRIPYLISSGCTADRGEMQEINSQNSSVQGRLIVRERGKVVVIGFLDALCFGEIYTHWIYQNTMLCHDLKQRSTPTFSL